VTTCRKILHWRTTLKWPQDRTKHLSRECLDFVRGLITDADGRLGTRGGVAELMAHPWFRGLDWTRLHELPAPYQGPPASASAPAPAGHGSGGGGGGSRLDEVSNLLARLPRNSPDFAPLLKELTANFDDFDNLQEGDPRALPGGAAGGGGALGAGGGGGAGGAPGGQSRASSARNRFIGYTFKRGQGVGAARPLTTATTTQHGQA
jgi:hypothetical protein